MDFLVKLNHLFVWGALLLATSLLGNAQPIAGFTATPSGSNCNPVIYNFTNASSGSNLKFEWNFGVYPGINSVFANPSTTYLNCGSFQVRLIAIDTVSRLRDTVIQTVQVRCSPTANFSASNGTGCVPFNAIFTNTSTPGSGSITQTVWDFGDGNGGQGNAISHAYNTTGCKNVTLIVTNTYGCTHDTTINSFICVNPKPVADFTSSAQLVCQPPANIGYQATSTGAPPLQYQWTFQGGVSSNPNAPNPSVTYPNVGQHNTLLIVTDANGCVDTVIKNNVVDIRNDSLRLQLPTTPLCAPATPNISVVPSAFTSSINWTVTPSSPINNAQSTGPSITLSTAGNYTICANATFTSGCTASKCTTLTVQPKPVANFGVNGLLNTCLVPNIVTFIDSSQGNNLRYNWAFPGGTPSVANIQVPVGISYGLCGNYSASLTVTDNAGCTSTATRSNFLNITCNQATYTVSPSNGCLPLTASFVGAATGNPVAWLWDFDDPGSGLNNFSTQQNPSHTFNTAGCYNVKLTVTDAQGCVSTYSLPAAVCAGWRPHANFSANPPLNCANQPIQFLDSSTGTYAYTQYYWIFADSASGLQTSVFQNPNHTFYDAGIWDITLIVSNYGCADSITKDDLVQTLDPASSPRVQYDCSNPLQVTLDGSQSPGADHYEWIVLGGAIPSNDTNAIVQVTFPGPGSYNASLFVTNDSTGCSDLQSTVVNITGTGAQFTGSPLNGCVPLRTCLSNTSTNAMSYEWKLFDSQGVFHAVYRVASPCFNLVTPEIYSVQLIVTDSSGCSDTLFKPNYISVSAPAASFSMPNMAPCAPTEVQFNDVSTARFSSIASWLWTFGDSLNSIADSSRLQNPSYTFIRAGDYTVQLAIMDSNGCVSSTRKLVAISKPTASYSMDTLVSCAGFNVCFPLAAIDSTYLYHWDFGDGTTADTANACHEYTLPGNYNMQLTVTDSSGCKDTLLSTIAYQRVLNQPNFVADTTQSTCPPLAVNFTNLTSLIDSATNWLWDFGDGQTSSLQHPFHIYTTAGSFTVSLIAYSSSGCVDTLLIPQYININGPSAYIATAPTSGCVPNTTCMSVVSNSATRFTWNLGDGTVINGTDSICYTYHNTGSYFPELILGDGTNCIFSLPMGQIDVDGAAAHFLTDTTLFCGEGIAVFTDSSYGNSPVVTWLWDFGDTLSGNQNISTVSNPSHHYLQAGTYAVRQTVSSAIGCVDSATTTIQVFGIPQPAIIASDTSPCAPFDIAFHTSNSSSIIANRYWNFGDTMSGVANTSVLVSPSHYYSTAGTYQVYYSELDSNGCRGNDNLTVQAHQKPIAAYALHDTCLNTQPIAFQNQSQFATHFVWDLGDGVRDSSYAPSYTYPDSGYYATKLIAYNDFCVDSALLPLNVFPLPIAGFSLPFDSVCGVPINVIVNNLSVGATAYQWDFGNGSTSILTNPSEVYANSGLYTVFLKAINQYGCQDTISKKITIFDKPLAAFTAQNVCLNTQPQTFINTSMGASNCYWDFGNGHYSSLPNPSYTYPDSGTYLVRLKVSNDHCSDSTSSPLSIYPLPRAGFVLPFDSICGLPVSIDLTNTSANALVYAWQYQTHQASNTFEPTITYTQPGQHPIYLQVANSFGCTDSVLKTFTVFADPVINNILLSDVEGCTPLEVDFSADVVGATNLVWYRPEDSSTLTQNPSWSQIYIDTGRYSIGLIALSEQGCADTLELMDTISIHGLPIADFSTFMDSSAYPFDGWVEFTNLSQAATSYWWSFGDDNTSTDTNPSHQYPDIDWYEPMLIASTEYGCTDTAAKQMYVMRKALYVPNALQPQHSGTDDLVKVWKPAGIGLKTYRAQVFDQWGKLLWESQALENTRPIDAWDGTFEGKPCPQDVYVWKIDATFVDGSPWPGMTYDADLGGGTKTIGSITLIR
ncbi:MAG: PKD domain-containing protein [Chitinophagales bacterium]|nr:PKD domain-containing protein [Chitinophagales bacterium]